MMAPVRIDLIPMATNASAESVTYGLNAVAEMVAAGMTMAERDRGRVYVVTPRPAGNGFNVSEMNAQTGELSAPTLEMWFLRSTGEGHVLHGRTSIAVGPEHVLRTRSVWSATLNKASRIANQLEGIEEDAPAEPIQVEASRRVKAEAEVVSIALEDVARAEVDFDVSLAERFASQVDPGNRDLSIDHTGLLEIRYGDRGPVSQFRVVHLDGKPETLIEATTWLHHYGADAWTQAQLEHMLNKVESAAVAMQSMRSGRTKGLEPL
jgi:hypothetical protein